MFGHRKMLISTTLVAIAAALAPTAAYSIAGDMSAYNVLNSSPLWADAGKSYHACNVVNVSTSPISLRLEVIDAGGAVLATSGAALVSVAARTSTETSAGNYTGFARCRVTTALNPELLRANLTVFRYTGTYYETLAVSEAR